ncbi:MAG TPA: DUF3106 domain-containing protein [Acidobacteriaceae bacterium]|jgi:DNA-directed RNA polymerase subunit F|nr:DUF3106 domain-containing protein [Acidobacteriaceae bacterium]
MACLRVIRRLFPKRAKRRNSVANSSFHLRTASFGILFFACLFCFALTFTSTASARQHGFGGGGHRGEWQHNGWRHEQQPRHQQHLSEWMRNHQNLTPEQQQRALHNEPGFNRLPPAEQQRLQNRLNQLNSMPPAQRERTLQHMEAVERLSPQQRQQLRHVMQQVSQMPMPRQRMMRKAFRDLRDLPPEQRQAILSSSQFKSQFSDQERQILGNLMSVEPYIPPNPPGNGTQYGGKQ